METGVLAGGQVTAKMMSPIQHERMFNAAVPGTRDHTGRG
jgi:hypothetical protein